MSDLFRVQPTGLKPARMLCHDVCQWISKAARANLEAKSDDSHSNLGWDSNNSTLVSQVLNEDLQLQLGYRFNEPALLMLESGNIVDATNVNSRETVAAWVTERLAGHSLKPVADIQLPHTLDDPVDYRDFDGLVDEIAVLGDWFSVAHDALAATTATLTDISPGPSPVHCWPHHFDIATLISFDSGDPETARSIGLGMSPGDGSYSEPYLYCSPYPILENLPAAPAPLQWHTQGFTSSVCTATALNNSQREMLSIFTDGLAIVRKALESN